METLCFWVMDREKFMFSAPMEKSHNLQILGTGIGVCTFDNDLLLWLLNKYIYVLTLLPLYTIPRWV